MKKFNIPEHYKSSIIGRIKETRRDSDPRKKDYSPTELDFGPVEFLIARHFGFCYGVENAIEIAYKTIEDNPDKRIFLLSEMIHNPAVNSDLLNQGVKFLMETSGKMLIDWNELKKDDIVIIPAFGTTLEIEEKLNSIGINPYRYNTTCPFVEKVWNKSAELAGHEFTVVIHGKHYHEETRATFSHSKSNSPSVIVRDLDEAKILSKVILGELNSNEFYRYFKDRYSRGFEIPKDLEKIGAVNQTTMLASETEEIADHFKETMIKKFGKENIDEHFADTRDTLCYATNDNQNAAYGLMEMNADLAIVVGGYNSSNTSHIVELLESKFSTYFISDAEKIISRDTISHFNVKNKSEVVTENYLPDKETISIALTSGASCPDATVDEVLNKILSFFNLDKKIDEVIKEE